MRASILTLRSLAASRRSPARRPRELRVYPPEVAISGPNRTQQLLVVEEENGRVVARPHREREVHDVATRRSRRWTRRAASPRPATARRRSPRPSAARRSTVDGEGRRPTSRGLELPQPRHPDAHAGRLQLRRVPRGARRQGRAEALAPRLTTPTSDHFVLTRQALGRRVDLDRTRRQPAAARRPTRPCRTAAARGSSRATPNYTLLLDWIAAGAPRPEGRRRRARAHRGLPAGRAAEAEGHAPRDRPGRLLRRHDRGRDPLGEVRVERGTGRRRGRGRRGHRRAATARRRSP